jgi:hypothetical protein
MSISIGPKIPVIVRVSEGDLWTAPGNSLLRALQPLVQPNVISLVLTSPPVSPTNGDTYVVGAGATGAWSGQDSSIVYWSTDNPFTPNGEWEFYAPHAGWMVINRGDNTPYIFNGSTWNIFASGGGGGQTIQAGTNLVQKGDPSGNHNVVDSRINDQGQGSLILFNVRDSDNAAIFGLGDDGAGAAELITFSASLRVFAQGGDLTLRANSGLTQFETQVSTGTSDVAGQVTLVGGTAHVSFSSVVPGGRNALVFTQSIAATPVLATVSADANGFDVTVPGGTNTDTYNYWVLIR